jgi:hypothetical protein
MKEAGTTAREQARMPPAARKRWRCPDDTGDVLANLSAVGKFGFMVNHASRSKLGSTYRNVKIMKYKGKYMHAPIPWLVARRDIHGDEQLRFDYGSAVSKRFGGMGDRPSEAAPVHKYGCQLCGTRFRGRLAKKAKQLHRFQCSELVAKV